MTEPAETKELVRVEKKPPRLVRVARKMACSRCTRRNLTTADFPRRPHAKTGYASVCKKCWGTAIKRGKSKSARVVTTKAPSDVELANQALTSVNHTPEFTAKQFGRIMRDCVHRLAARGVGLESIRIENGKIKTVYRMEQEITL